ncbi:MAG: ImmA/IrrE family metallo-endopeptidase [Solirubrobacterales bacterium]
MLDDLASRREIIRLTERLLRDADAYGTLPTPVPQIVRTAGLTEASPMFLSSNSIAEAPAHLRAALRRVRSKVHAALDRRTREVLINPEVDRGAQGSFKRLHETAHDLFPWQHLHRDGFADDAFTLSARTAELFEQEANQGAAELLFQRSLFAEMAADYAIGCAAIVELAQLFGASRHAAFRRYVESHSAAVAGVVLDTSAHSREPLAFRRFEAICSRSWLERFEHPGTWPRVMTTSPFTFVAHTRPGEAPRGWHHVDRNFEAVTLSVDAMSNFYKRFALIWVPKRELFKRRRVLATTI